MTEDEARAALAAFDGLGGLEHWIAAQRWNVVPGGWVVPEAFRIAGLHARGKLDMAPDRAVRLACRDAFRRTGLLSKIIPGIEAVLKAGELPRPDPPPEALGPAFPDVTSGDAGHRG